MSGVLELQDILLFGAPIVGACLLLGVAHWYPWNRGAKPLRRREAYAIGTSVVVGSPISAMLLAQAMAIPKDEWFWIAHLIVNTAACGITVSVAHWIDEGTAIGLREGTNDADPY
jgi:hypothetical protein